MAITYIRGVPGILAMITGRGLDVDDQLKRLFNEYNGRDQEVPVFEAARLLGELHALTDLRRALQSAIVISEEDHDNLFKIGGYGSPGEAIYAVTLS